MDFIKTEEKLISTQIQINKRIKQSELLSRVDAFTSKMELRLPEKIQCTIKSSESLSKDSKLILPLKVRGSMLGIGKHKEKYYRLLDLLWSIDFHKDKKFPIKVDHRNLEVGSMVGTVDRIFWDETEQSVAYEGHINDETQARNILDGMVTEVSATIFARGVPNDKFGIIGLEPEYTELSLVVNGAYENSTIIPVV